MGAYGIPIIAVSVTLAALGFSIFSTVYSNLVHSAEMADGNAIQSGGRKSYLYWSGLSNHLRELVKSRAYSANLCYLSLLSIVATLILYLISAPDFSGTLMKSFCAGTFVLSVVLLGVALFFATFLWGHKRAKGQKGKEHKGFLWLLLKVLRKVFWPVYAHAERLPFDLSEE
jgi:hypothetical protein